MLLEKRENKMGMNDVWHSKAYVALLGALCFLLGITMPVCAKMKDPDLKTSGADYYILNKGTNGNSGEASAKLLNTEAEIVIPEEVTINNKSYIVTEITGLNYADTVDKGLKHDSFKNRKNDVTEKIVLPRTIKTIQKGAFSNYTKLKTIEINPENPHFIFKGGAVLSIDGKTLYGTITLKKSYAVPKGVKKIEDRAFAYSKVKSVILPKSCNKIGDRAFYRCSKLKTVKRLDKVKIISEGAFWGSKVKTSK